MDAETRVTALSSQHLYLEHAISQENQRPSPDFIRITELKREKVGGGAQKLQQPNPIGDARCAANSDNESTFYGHRSAVVAY